MVSIFCPRVAGMHRKRRGEDKSPGLSLRLAEVVETGQGSKLGRVGRKAEGAAQALTAGDFRVGAWRTTTRLHGAGSHGRMLLNRKKEVTILYIMNSGCERPGGPNLCGQFPIAATPS